MLHAILLYVRMRCTRSCAFQLYWRLIYGALSYSLFSAWWYKGRKNFSEWLNQKNRNEVRSFKIFIEAWFCWHVVWGLQLSCTGCKWRWRLIAPAPLTPAHDRWSPQTSWDVLCWLRSCHCSFINKITPSMNGCAYMATVKESRSQ